MKSLSENIAEYGIHEPLLVRAKEDGRYEILSGHNRCHAAKLAGLTQVPCIIKDVDDAEAVFIVTDTNLQQRDELLPSEKAHAYKMQMDTLKKQGKTLKNTH